MLVTTNLQIAQGISFCDGRLVTTNLDVAKMVGWVPSPLSRGLSGVPGFEVAPLAQFTPSSGLSGLAVSGQERTSISVVPPGGGGSAASEGWRCHSDLLEVDFDFNRLKGGGIRSYLVIRCWGILRVLMVSRWLFVILRACCPAYHICYM